MRISYANVVATLALIFAVGGSAVAATSTGSSQPKTLKLCALKKNGDLRLLASGACRSTERAVNVDREAVDGAPGAAGATGPQGATGAPGPQGERGPAGPGTVLTSPDGRFSVSATNAGIVLTGPSGKATFDGETLRSEKGLNIVAGTGISVTAATNLTITNGAAFSLTSGTAANVTTGGAFSQSVGGQYGLTVGADATTSYGNNLSQTVAKSVSESYGANYTQSVGGSSSLSTAASYGLSVGNALTQQAKSISAKASTGPLSLTTTSGDVELKGKNVGITGRSSDPAVKTCITLLSWTNRSEFC